MKYPQGTIWHKGAAGFGASSGRGSGFTKRYSQTPEISLQYLEHLVTPLIIAGMVRSVRGPKGGITLAKSPAKITMSEIIQLLEGSTALVECVDNPKLCPRADSCVTRDIWTEVKDAVNGVLDSTTLQI